MYIKKCDNLARALTILEMVIALAIIAVVFAVVLPQFANIRNSWNLKIASAEVIQNGRVLIDHITRNISNAVVIKNVSLPDETNGFIEFQDWDGNDFRYQINGNNYVEFGPLGDLGEIAGPVSQLQFTCYALTDLVNPTMSCNVVRVVEVELTVTDPSGGTRDRILSTSVFLMINGNDLPRIIKESEFEFDPVEGQMPDLCKITETRFLCAYSGPDNDGWAVVLGVDKSTWNISKFTPFEFESVSAIDPSICAIDMSHYLCVYTGPDDHGWVTVLTVDAAGGGITQEVLYEFESGSCRWPQVTQVDKDHYLCVYTGPSSKGYATIITVNDTNWMITNTSPTEFDNIYGVRPSICRVRRQDSANYLCAYTGPGDRGWAVVLNVKISGGQILKKSAVVFDQILCNRPCVVNFSDYRCLCLYEGEGSDGWSVVFGIDSVNWQITPETPFEFDMVHCQEPSMVVEDVLSLCVYGGKFGIGMSEILGVDTSNWTIIKGNPLVFCTSPISSPDVEKLDSAHYLCVYEGPDLDGWTVLLGIDYSVLP